MEKYIQSVKWMCINMCTPPTLHFWVICTVINIFSDTVWWASSSLGWGLVRWKKLGSCVSLFWCSEIWCAVQRGEVGTVCGQDVRRLQCCFLPVSSVWRRVSPEWRAVICSDLFIYLFVYFLLDWVGVWTVETPILTTCPNLHKHKLKQKT